MAHECLIMRVSTGAGLQSTAGDGGRVHVEAGAGPSERIATYSSSLRGREEEPALRVVCCLYESLYKRRVTTVIRFRKGGK